MESGAGLFEQLCSFENLYRAYRKARRGKRAKAAVATFEYDQESELVRLQDELRGGTWKPGPYHSFTIHDPKRRLISAAPFRDRVVHHALCNLIEPAWERSFIYDSYANRIGKGTHLALLRCQQFARRYAYVLQCDVKQFFPSIDHAILRSILGQKMDDAAVMKLIDQILASGRGVLDEVYEMTWFEGDDLLAALRPRGLPIGNLTSQFWANVYLNGFDHFVKRQLGCPAYLRYVDDFLLFSDSKPVLWKWKEAIVNRMADLRLTLHEPQVVPVGAGIPFLGFRIFPTHRRLKRRRGIAFQRHFRRLYRRWLERKLPHQKLNETVRSWVAHAAWGDTYGLRRSILSANPIGLDAVR